MPWYPASEAGRYLGVTASVLRNRKARGTIRWTLGADGVTRYWVDEAIAEQHDADKTGRNEAAQPRPLPELVDLNARWLSHVEHVTGALETVYEGRLSDKDALIAELRAELAEAKKQASKRWWLFGR